MTLLRPEPTDEAGLQADTGSLLPEHAVVLPPDTVGYRVKRKLLGPPMHSEELEHERLGKPTALAVFASDNLSSSAYATEEILHVLVPAIGLVAFSLVVPVTLAMLVVLGFLILSYRETIKAYPSAGGAYTVTLDNFGVLPAQVAGAALLTDYILTVAVSVAAGTAALASAFHALEPYRVPIAIGFVLIVAFGNLRGVKESGKVFAVPTYFFILNMVVLIAVGMYRKFFGDLPHAEEMAGQLHLGHEASGDGWLYGASMLLVLKGFASGGAAVTGVEAISNGVSAFKKPSWKNARETLVVMGILLGVMFLGLSMLAGEMRVIPFHDGTPTVISQIGDLVYGHGLVGEIGFFALQAGTMLILVLAANTSFADFPRLASIQAGDQFLPRWLTKRGHRLVFSNGILFLSVFAIALLLTTRARVEELIPLYAVGVFTSFTLSQAGMTKHHLRLREEGWRKGLVINGVGAALSLLVLVVIAWMKFPDGAWKIVFAIPVIVVLLFRLSKQYAWEDEQLEHGVPEAIKAPIMRRHVVLVFIDRFDLASARAVQYARALTPDELRAVHFMVDEQAGKELETAWLEHGMARIGLDLVDCPDRRLTRRAVQVVAGELADGGTEVSVLLPDRKYRGVWHRILHDQTAEAIERALSRLPHANVTTVPFHFDTRRPARAQATDELILQVPRLRGISGNGASGNGSSGYGSASDEAQARVRPDGSTEIGSVRARRRVRIEGRVRTMRIHPVADSTSLEVIVEDETGAISAVFLGRPSIPGIGVGTHLRLEGMAGDHHGRLAMLNPAYELGRKP